ncbi:DUF2513 domain-containing protein [Fusobacterium varium]
MKLNLDCVRDVLKKIEKKLENGNPVFFNQETYKNFKMKYSKCESTYHILYCIEVGLLERGLYSGNSDLMIRRITELGKKLLREYSIERTGEFLDKIIYKDMKPDVKNLIEEIKEFYKKDLKNRKKII